MARRTRTVVALACTMLVLATASCSTKIESTSTAPAGTDGPTTTVGNYGSSVTTAPPPSTIPLSNAQLTSLLPTVAEIGEGYQVVKPVGGAASETDKEWDDATRKACPDLYKLYANFSQVLTVAYSAAPATASRLFVDAFSREVGVSLIEGDSFIPTEEQLEKIVSATNACDPIEVDDPVTGGTIAVTLQASPDSHYGDLGMVMTMDVNRRGGLLGKVTVKSTGHVRTFQRGPTTVSITTVDGYDPTTFRKVRVDYRLAADLAEKLDAEIQKLHGN